MSHSILLSRLSKFGLYAITNNVSEDILLTTVKEAILGGVGLLQFRSKGGIFKEKEKIAHQLLKLCWQSNVPLIVNDDIALAKKIKAHGVHLGKNDAPVWMAREALGSKAVIGVSCYDDIDLALEMEKQKVNYVAFGRVFSSITKPDAVKCDLSVIKEAKKKLSIPIIAIGGITVDNAKSVFESGADFCATINGLFASKDIHETARRFNQLKFIS